MVASVDDTFGMLNFMGKKSTVSDIRSALVLGIIPYGIFSDTWLVQCTSRILHVVPLMSYLLAYCLLLLLSLVGLVVCGCIQTI